LTVPAQLRTLIRRTHVLGVMVSRHLIKSDELTAADPGKVIDLLRACMTALAAQPAAP
jgi:hypothetical protein